MTKEDIQKKIDHYAAVAEAEDKLGDVAMFWFYTGKRDAYINLLKDMYPDFEEDRVYPFNDKRHNDTVQFITKVADISRRRKHLDK